MKSLARAFFILGLLGLLLFAELRSAFVPIPMRWNEAAFIIGAWGFSLGWLASLTASLFASIAARRNNLPRGQGLLLGCCFLLLGFLAVLVV